jgi:hypothetical protein
VETQQPQQFAKFARKVQMFPRAINVLQALPMLEEVTAWKSDVFTTLQQASDLIQGMISEWRERPIGAARDLSGMAPV